MVKAEKYPLLLGYVFNFRLLYGKKVKDHFLREFQDYFIYAILAISLSNVIKDVTAGHRKTFANKIFVRKMNLDV